MSQGDVTNEKKYTVKWKINIYGKFVQELERRLRKLAAGADGARMRNTFGMFQRPISH